MKNQNVMSRPVLVLNTAYESIQIVSTQKAITMIYKGNAIMELAEGELKSNKWVFPLPSVIRLRNFSKVPKFKQNFSKKNVHLRDAYLCQYCGEQLNDKSATLDHIIPKSRGGSNNFENLVSCCKPCNSKKDDRSLGESGMVLKSKPKSYFSFYRSQLFKKKKRDGWENFLFID